MSLWCSDTAKVNHYIGSDIISNPRKMTCEEHSQNNWLSFTEMEFQCAQKVNKEYMKLCVIFKDARFKSMQVTRTTVVIQLTGESE